MSAAHPIRPSAAQSETTVRLNEALPNTRPSSDESECPPIPDDWDTLESPDSQAFSSLTGRTPPKHTQENTRREASVELPTSKVRLTAVLGKMPRIEEIEGGELEWVVDELIAAAEIVFIAGESTHGKSRLITAMVGAISTGGKVLGRQCQKRHVLYLDRENPLFSVKMRLKHLGVETGEYLEWWGRWFSKLAPAPDDAEIVHYLEGMIAQGHKPPVVIVDAFQPFFQGDENSAKEVTAFFDRMRLVADLGCVVVILANTGKVSTAKEYKGSAQIKAGVDRSFTLVNTNTKSGKDGGLDRLVLQGFKVRFDVQTRIEMRYIDHSSPHEFRADYVPVKPKPVNQLTELLKNNAQTTKSKFEQLATASHISSVKGAREFLDDGVINNSIIMQKNQKANGNYYYLNPNSSGSTEPLFSNTPKGA